MEADFPRAIIYLTSASLGSVTAWFITHRIRDAFGHLPSMGGPGARVEVDETFIGRKQDMPRQRGHAHEHAVLTPVERGKGSRSFHVDGTKAKDVLPIIKAKVARETQIVTDEAGQYAGVKKHFAAHASVSHGKDAHTDIVEVRRCGADVEVRRCGADVEVRRYGADQENEQWRDSYDVHRVEPRGSPDMDGGARQQALRVEEASRARRDGRFLPRIFLSSSWPGGSVRDPLFRRP